MSDESVALSTVLPSAPTEADYQAICATILRSARGRWFLEEYARRNRNADTLQVLDAIARIEGVIRGERGREAYQSFRAELADMARAIALTRSEVADIAIETGPATPRAPDIAGAAERLQDVAWTMREHGIDPATCDQIEAVAAAILGAASLRNPDDRRAQKLSEALGYLERRINTMLEEIAQTQMAATPPAGPPTAEPPVSARHGVHDSEAQVRTTEALPAADGGPAVARREPDVSLSEHEAGPSLVATETAAAAIEVAVEAAVSPRLMEVVEAAVAQVLADHRPPPAYQAPQQADAIAEATEFEAAAPPVASPAEAAEPQDRPPSSMPDLAPMPDLALAREAPVIATAKPDASAIATSSEFLLDVAPLIVTPVVLPVEAPPPRAPLEHAPLAVALLFPAAGADEPVATTAAPREAAVAVPQSEHVPQTAATERAGQAHEAPAGDNAITLIEQPAAAADATARATLANIEAWAKQVQATLAAENQTHATAEAREIPTDPPDTAAPAAATVPAAATAPAIVTETAVAAATVAEAAAIPVTVAEAAAAPAAVPPQPFFPRNPVALPPEEEKPPGEAEILVGAWETAITKPVEEAIAPRPQPEAAGASQQDRSAGPADFLLEPAPTAEAATPPASSRDEIAEIEEELFAPTAAKSPAAPAPEPAPQVAAPIAKSAPAASPPPATLPASVAAASAGAPPSSPGPALKTPPAAADPLAALKAMTDEERIALFT
jgi:hypothetical protein